jgi:ATP-dependent RNA helicase RhlB
VNWDLPQDPEDYVHRIGRTARAGAGGKAIALVDEASALNLEGIEKFIGQKILVEWPEDDLIVSEIKPTAEERRRYSEEKRARFEARRGRDDRGGRGGRGGPGGGGGGRDRGHRPPDRSRGPEPRRDAPRPDATREPSPGAASPGASTSPGGSGRPRRRRGRRGGRGGAPPPTPGALTP